MMRFSFLFGVLVVTAATLGSEEDRAAPEASKLPPAAAGAVDFARDVQPLFAKACVGCHGPAKQRGGFRLDDGAEALKGGNSGPVIKPGDAAGSRLLHIVAGLDAETKMPPEGKPPLTAEEIGRLRAWIEQGAKWPQGTTASATPTPASSHWAFQALRRPAESPVANRAWVRNAIDAFVLARLEAEKIAPSPEADRATLLRRLNLDLLGLPPTPEEIEAFRKDARPDAYERLADRLLASPHYGERWGRHWLDQARYADSNGYSVDGPRTMWPYRDWVINALNGDLPFDRFTVEQLAGDLLPAPTRDQLIATGFHRNTLINQEGGTDPEQFRVEANGDRASTTGTVWLGLSVGCAQCHDHKFDPTTQRDYYRLFAFFNTAADRNAAAPTLALPSPQQAAELGKLDRALAEAKKGLAEYDEQAKADKEAAAAKGPARAALVKEVDRHTKGRKTVEQQIPTTLVMAEAKEARKTHVHIRGDFLRKGVEVGPGVPAFLPPLDARGLQPVGAGKPTRLDLARWLVDPRNPLTARVTVNRVWMRYFGTGLVETENDFGTQGTPPTHPELLDWLAGEFVQSGWSLKALHRLIVTSAVYRQSSQPRPELKDRDPLNRLLARQNRLRVEAEVVRDLALAAGGLLNPKVGGPSVYPPQPDGVFAFTQTRKAWPTSAGPDRYRRTLYTFFYRSAPYPLLTTFDSPDFATVCTRRLRSNTPLQALTVANDRGLVELAQALALRVLAEEHADERARLTRTFRLCLSREPDAVELDHLERYLGSQRAAFRADTGAAAKAIFLPKPEDLDDATVAAWTGVARVLMNLDEFITRE